MKNRNKDVMRIYYVFAIFNGFTLPNKPEAKWAAIQLYARV